MLRRKPRPKADGLPIPKAPPRARVKPGRHENAKHVAWVHDWACVVAHTGECSGPVVAHHLLQPWAGVRGGALRSDDRNVIPLCDGHHKELHSPYGRDDTFFFDKAGDPNLGRKTARQLWEESPYREGVE